MLKPIFNYAKLPMIYFLHEREPSMWTPPVGSILYGYNTCHVLHCVTLCYKQYQTPYELPFYEFEKEFGNYDWLFENEISKSRIMRKFEMPIQRFWISRPQKIGVW